MLTTINYAAAWNLDAPPTPEWEDSSFLNLQLDYLPGQELMRRALLVHNGRIYNASFSPAEHTSYRAK